MTRTHSLNIFSFSWLQIQINVITSTQCIITANLVWRYTVRTTAWKSSDLFLFIHKHTKLCVSAFKNIWCKYTTLHRMNRKMKEFSKTQGTVLCWLKWMHEIIVYRKNVKQHIEVSSLTCIKKYTNQMSIIMYPVQLLSAVSHRKMRYNLR